MAEHQEWRLETYMDEADPFATIQYYVMRGNVMIAQSEIQAHAVQIIVEHERLLVYQRALEEISTMTPGDGIESAVAAAQGALNQPGTA